jgi:hypothetical protein
LINFDVPKFFSSVRHYVLADVLHRYLPCGREITWMLTRLMTLEPQLPQGAPTSTAAANFLLKHAVDEVVSEKAGEIGAVNTRFVDDVSLSGTEPRPLINVTARALSRCRLSIHRPSAKNRANPKFRRLRAQFQQYTEQVPLVIDTPTLSIVHVPEGVEHGA